MEDPFPVRMSTNFQSQVVIILLTPLGHMSKDVLIALAKSMSEEQRDPENHTSIIVNWVPALTAEEIRDHLPRCKKVCSFFSEKIFISESTLCREV